MTLNRDSTLTLKIHIIQHLPLGNLNRLRFLQQAVSERWLSMIYMCDDTEISNIIYRVHCFICFFIVQS